MENMAAHGLVGGGEIIRMCSVRVPMGYLRSRCGSEHSRLIERIIMVGSEILLHVGIHITELNWSSIIRTSYLSMFERLELNEKVGTRNMIHQCS